MIKLRAVDRLTKHIKGRAFLGNDKGIIFPSSEKIFLKKLEEKILMSTKDFEHGGVVLTFLELKIK